MSERDYLRLSLKLSFELNERLALSTEKKKYAEN